jgi:hypothetical protein
MSLGKGHVSRHRLTGSLSDTPFTQLLEALKQQLFTGSLIVDGDTKQVVFDLRGGSVDSAKVGGKAGNADAVAARLAKLRDGSYEVRQRLPDLGGALGSAATLEGEVGDVPMPEIMRHCEDYALTCTLIVVGGFDRGEITYRAGEIVGVLLNGKPNMDAIVDIVGWKGARFRVTAPPLQLNVLGWPAVTREPTQPFKVEHVAPEVAAGKGAEPAADRKKIPEVPLAMRPAIVRRLRSLLGRH